MKKLRAVLLICAITFFLCGCVGAVLEIIAFPIEFLTSLPELPEHIEEASEDISKLKKKISGQEKREIELEIKKELSSKQPANIEKYILMGERTLKEAPNFKSKTLYKIKQIETIYADWVTDNWVEVRTLNGQKGWVRKEWVYPVFKDIPKLDKGSKEYFLFLYEQESLLSLRLVSDLEINKDSIALYELPSDNAEISGFAYGSDGVTLLDVLNETMSWIQVVSSSGDIGWVKKNSVISSQKWEISTEKFEWNIARHKMNLMHHGYEEYKQEIETLRESELGQLELRNKRVILYDFPSLFSSSDKITILEVPKESIMPLRETTNWVQILLNLPGNGRVGWIQKSWSDPKISNQQKSIVGSQDNNEPDKTKPDKVRRHSPITLVTSNYEEIIFDVTKIGNEYIEGTAYNPGTMLDIDDRRINFKDIYEINGKKMTVQELKGMFSR